MPKSAALPDDLLDPVARTFAVLGEPSRLRILRTLMAEPLPVNTIVERTGLGQANVSRHLGVLTDAGLLARTRHGTQIIYEIADPLVHQLCQTVCGSLKDRFRRQARALAGR